MKSANLKFFREQAKMCRSDGMISLKESAEMLGCEISKMSLWIHREDLPVAYRNRACWFKPQDVMEWADDNRDLLKAYHKRSSTFRDFTPDYVALRRKNSRRLRSGQPPTLDDALYDYGILLKQIEAKTALDKLWGREA